MSRVRNKNTAPEMLVRKFLFSKGFRFRLHDKKLPGKPDIILPKYRTVIFINGCFWHGHENCKYSSIPKTNLQWWTEKIQKNKLRDISNICDLFAQNWRVITIFGCELKRNNVNITLEKLVNELNKFALSG
jgi:DNA mismatch endonuclease (patch repair protein)